MDLSQLLFPIYDISHSFLITMHSFAHNKTIKLMANLDGDFNSQYFIKRTITIKYYKV